MEHCLTLSLVLAIISTLITPSPNSAYLATNAHLMKSESKWLMLGQLSAVRIFPQICSGGKITKNQCNMTQYTKYADTELKTFLSLHSGYFTHAQAVKWSLPMCVWRKKFFSAEIIEIFWDTMSHSKFFMAEIEDKQSLKMSISAAFQTTFNRFPCPHAHPALTSTAAKLLLVAKDRLSRNSFEISQTPYYSRAPTPTPIDPKHANCPLFSSLSIVAWLHGDLVVRFPTPLAPGSDIPIHVSWGTRLWPCCSMQCTLHSDLIADQVTGMKCPLLHPQPIFNFHVRLKSLPWVWHHFFLDALASLGFLLESESLTH